MKNNLQGLLLLFGMSSFVTLITIGIAQNQVASTDTAEQSVELYEVYVENASHVKPRDLMQDSEEAKEEHDKKMQGLFRSAMIDRDAENKKKYNKELKKVAPQAKFKPMPKDPSIEQKDTFQAIAQVQQEVRIALWEEDQRYYAVQQQSPWWKIINTVYASKQSNTPAGNGYQSRCEKRGDQETTASEKNSPCRVAEASTNEVAAYNAYLLARLNHGPALEQDFCKENPASCSTASSGGLIPIAMASAREWGGASKIKMHGFREQRRQEAAKEIEGSKKAVEEANRQYQEHDLAQNEQLRVEVKIMGEKAENKRLKVAGGNSADETPKGTKKYPEKFHNSASGQGGTQQQADA